MIDETMNLFFFMNLPVSGDAALPPSRDGKPCTQNVPP